MLNRLEFDCVAGGNECLRQTANLRSTFAPLLEKAVRYVYRQVLTLVGNEVEEEAGLKGVHHNLACSTDMLPEDFRWDRLVSVVDNLMLSEGQGEEGRAETELAGLASRLFRHPLNDVAKGFDDFLEQNNATSDPDCQGAWDMCFCALSPSKNMSKVTRAHVAALVKALGNRGSPLLFGDLLGEYSFMLEYGTVPITESMLQFLSILDDATNTLMDQEDGLTIADISNYVQSFTVSNLGTGRTMTQTYNCSRVEASVFLDESATGSLCEGDRKGGDCCKLEKSIKESKGAVNKLMKYGERIEGQEVVEKSKQEDLDRVLSRLDDKFPRTESWADNRDPLVFACKFGALSVPMRKNCSLFIPFYTTKKIGVTFNSMDFWDLYRKTESNALFYHELQERQSSTDPDKENKTTEPHKAKFSGPGK